MTAAAAAGIVLLLAGIFLVLVANSRLSLSRFGLDILWGTEWNPVTGHYGALSSIYGTILSTLVAMLIAVPLSFLSAFFLVEVAPTTIAGPVGAAIELLAAVPSIIYGMWGLFVFVPIMATDVQPLLGRALGLLPLFTGPPLGIGILTAGIILAVMILPFMTAVIRDVLEMTPRTMKEAAFGMGATTWEVTRDVALRHGRVGIVGGLFLGLGRALGETMAVTFVIGNSHKISASLMSPGNTIASTLANEFAEASSPLYLSTLTELALILFGITFLVNAASQLLLARARSTMEGRR